MCLVDVFIWRWLRVVRTSSQGRGSSSVAPMLRWGIYHVGLNLSVVKAADIYSKIMSMSTMANNSLVLYYKILSRYKINTSHIIPALLVENRKQFSENYFRSQPVAHNNNCYCSKWAPPWHVHNIQNSFWNKIVQNLGCRFEKKINC